VRFCEIIVVNSFEGKGPKGTHSSMALQTLAGPSKEDKECCVFGRSVF
jgi:hypothetical protein